MGEDLRKYYVQQFQTMQKDLNGIISGMIHLLITSPMCHHLIAMFDENVLGCFRFSGERVLPEIEFEDERTGESLVG